MKRTPVSSSNIKAIGYDPESQLLEVEFNQGAVYEYRLVPAAVHQALMSAGSIGQYFAANIKGQYPTRSI
jgi:hypothetical protein